MHSHAGDMWEPCKDHVRQRLGGERSVSYQPPRNLKPCKPMQDEEIAARYAYHDENGELLFEVIRTASKKFLQRTKDGWGLNGHDHAGRRLVWPL